MGVATQCLIARKCTHAKDQYWANVMLKYITRFHSHHLSIFLPNLGSCEARRNQFDFRIRNYELYNRSCEPSNCDRWVFSRYVPYKHASSTVISRCRRYSSTPAFTRTTFFYGCCRKCRFERGQICFYLSCAGWKAGNDKGPQGNGQGTTVAH